MKLTKAEAYTVLEVQVRGDHCVGYNKSFLSLMMSYSCCAGGRRRGGGQAGFQEAGTEMVRASWGERLSPCGAPPREDARCRGRSVWHGLGASGATGGRGAASFPLPPGTPLTAPARGTPRRHPDKNNGSDESNEMFKKLNAAYARLTSSEDDDDLDGIDPDDLFDDELFAELFGGGRGGFHPFFFM